MYWLSRKSWNEQVGLIKIEKLIFVLNLKEPTTPPNFIIASSLILEGNSLRITTVLLYLMPSSRASHFQVLGDNVMVYFNADSLCHVCVPAVISDMWKKTTTIRYRESLRLDRSKAVRKCNRSVELSFGIKLAHLKYHLCVDNSLRNFIRNFILNQDDKKKKGWLIVCKLISPVHDEAFFF